MIIKLNTECFDLLLKHVSMESPAYDCLKKAVKVFAITATVIAASWFDCLDCTPEHLDAFLDAARNHFPDRVKEIEESIARAIDKAV